jgi:hypothetical protein
LTLRVVVVVVVQSSLESRRVSVGKMLSRDGCSGTQTEEPLPALCCVVKCNTLLPSCVTDCDPINPVDNPNPVYVTKRVTVFNRKTCITPNS